MKTRKLLTVVVASIAFAVTAFAQTVPPTDGLVGYWGFDGNADDQSGNGNNGTVNGATLTTDRFGNADSAYSFDGVSNSIQVSNNANSITNKTFSAWVLLNSLSQSGGGLVSIEMNGSSIFDAIVYNEFNNGWMFGSEWTSRFSTSNYSETNNQWVNITCSYAPNDYRMYRNGVLIHQTTNHDVLPFVNGSFIFGKRHSAGGENAFLNGKIDDIAIYNRALTAAEINQLYITNSQAPASVQSFTVNDSTEGHENSTYAWSISPAAPKAVITGNGTNSISIAWGYTPAGNYLVQSVETNSADCIAEPVNTFVIVSDSGLAPATFSVVSPVNYCKGATAAPLTATASENSTLIWYATATTQTALTSVPTPLTTAASTKTFYVSEKNPEGVESERIPIEVIVSDLPKTPAALTLTSIDDTPRIAGLDGLVGLNTLAKITKIGPYIGTYIGFTLTATASALANHYRWELPEGVYSADLDEDHNSESPIITVNFANVTPGSITPLTIKVYAVNDCGDSPAKALILTRALPKAPSKLVLTSPDTTPRFANADGVLVGLNTLEKITNVGPYMAEGGNSLFTLTATYAAPPAQGSEVTQYHWTLPEGVYSIYSFSTDFYTTESTISVYFIVPPGITDLNVSVQAINGNGAAAAKVLVLKRALPKAPSKLVLTSADRKPRFASASGALVGLNTLEKITKVGPYYFSENDPVMFTLTAVYAAPPKQGSEAQAYHWILPEGVYLELGYFDEDVAYPYDFYTEQPTIPVYFKGQGITDLNVSVQAINGNGPSEAKVLVLKRALPKAPSKLVLTDGVSTAAITTVSNYIGTDTELTLTATAVTAQGTEAAKYHWDLPEGVWTDDLDGEGNSDSPIINVIFAGVASGVTTLPISVFAVNGNGTSTAKILALRIAKPSTPGSITGALNFNPSCSDAIIVEVPNVDGVSYTWSVNGTEAAVTSEDNLNAAIIDVSKVTTATITISVIAKNGAGSSAAKTLVIPKVDTCDSITPTRSKVIPETFKAVAYPNPATSVFTLDVNLAKGTSAGVQVYDMAGRFIEKRQIKSGPTQFGANYPSGTYILKVSQGKNLQSLQVIKH